MSDAAYQTSHSLIRRACDLTDDSAWEEFVGQYRRFICYILVELGVRQEDVEDLAQQILFSLTKNLSGYDRSRASFRTWLSRVVRNATLNYFQQNRTRQVRLAEYGKDRAMGTEMKGAEVEDRIQREWAVFVVNQAMEKVRGVFQGQAVQVFELGLAGCVLQLKSRSKRSCPLRLFILCVNE